MPLMTKSALWQPWDMAVKIWKEGGLGTSRAQFWCLGLSLFTVVRFLKIGLVVRYSFMAIHYKFTEYIAGSWLLHTRLCFKLL